MRYSKIRNTCILTLILFILQSCVVIPQTVENDSNCELYTKQITLKMKQLENLEDISSRRCSNETCLLLLFAPVTVSAVVSGSIMVAENTIHWIEKEGRCDEDIVAENVAKTSKAVTDSGGYIVDNKGKMIDWMENVSTLSSEEDHLL